MCVAREVKWPLPISHSTILTKVNSGNTQISTIKLLIIWGISDNCGVGEYASRDARPHSNASWPARQ